MKAQIICLLLTIGFVTGCNSLNDGRIVENGSPVNNSNSNISMNSNVAAAIASAAAKKRGNTEKVIFNLKNLTDFDWDKVYIFAPHTPQKTIEQSVGGSVPSSALSDIASRDDICLMLFVKGGRVVQKAELPRGKGDFSKFTPSQSFTPETAVFEVREEDRGEPWLTVYPAEN